MSWVKQSHCMADSEDHSHLREPANDNRRDGALYSSGDRRIRVFRAAYCGTTARKHADHVTEIRILDLEPYVNKLDYMGRIPVIQHIGSINDLDLVLKACAGATCVIHLASFVDFSMFPDTRLLEEVNVRGTETVIYACQKSYVQRLVYCSSVYVVIGNSDINGGTESCTEKPDTYQLKYAHTKSKAEALVLKANDPQLTTLVIRPAGLYGEGDKTIVTISFTRVSNIRSRTFRKIRLGVGRQQFVYVGNAAWMFVCAEKELFRITRERKRFLPTDVGGELFFCSDDTPVLKAEDFSAIFQEACGLREVKPALPLWIIKCIVFFLFCIISIVRIACSVNIPLGPSVLSTVQPTWWFRYDKAKTLLGYKPLYNWQTSKERSFVYYSSFCKTTSNHFE